MITKTEGIVLKTLKYGEADLIVTYLTPDRGLIRAFAKSSRKTKSRFGSSLEPLTHARIALWGKEQTSLSKITQADILNSFHPIRENYNDFVYVSKLAETLISFTPEAIPNIRLFAFFLNILNIIKDTDLQGSTSLHIISQIRLLKHLGFAPRLSSCGRCGGMSHDFYPDAGTTLCPSCVKDPRHQSKPFVKISNQAIHFYSHCIEWPIDKSNRLKPNQGTLAELSGILDRHVSFMLSKKLMTSKFIENRGTASKRQ
ncbi:MAG: DNA repair protein RecO [Nitrospira sp.]|nr:DNA repair protein RecO [bacterium]MBL7048941.1 DNA repair protein RecO [Nitrospira sp.]